ncbi:MAG: hypothetical protein ONA90_01370 [candidate division KSB1 bacterium]|nr:hypothetical protein [candidate division KSB1 bacterium]
MMAITARKNLTVIANFPGAPREKNTLRLALLLSLLLHVFGFLLAGLTQSRWWAAQPKADQRQASSPLLVFTLAETPESARRETPPEKAEHVSDKNAVAHNPTAPEQLPTEAPYATGAFAEATTAPAPPANPVGPQNASAMSEGASASPSKKTIASRETESITSTFSREFLTGAQPKTQRPQSPSTEAGRKNLDSRTLDLGSFSLNTYEWDFAPYMLWLKRQIQRNIYPPPAFTHMGIISGRTRLRFRIYRDGTLHGLELLGFEGHKSLMETSVRAVELSVPFRTLPSDFPEEYLEVTAQFEYTVTH